MNAHIGTLVGQQKEAMRFFFLLCKQKGDRALGPITREQIANQVNQSKDSVKTTISRLCKKGFLIRHEGKQGRGGFLNLEIPEPVYQQMTMQDSTERELHDIAKRDTKQGTERETHIPSRSSLLDSNKTTSTRQPLEGEWADVQIPEILKTNKISSSVIFQCRDRNLIGAEDLQESLNAFAFDISENDVLTKKMVLNPQAWFMSAINHNRGYAQTANYESDEDKAEKEMLERLEMQAHERKNRKKRIFELQFEEWKKGLTEEEKQKLKPRMAKSTHGPAFEAALKDHFTKHVLNEGSTHDDARAKEEEGEGAHST